ncbi:DNA methyltransferase [Comamonas sp. NLF-1-9]|uniref:class I SAM-dependent DNA methyltransferase n=1 Tax=Comamonas sp. NLF-1-9 TaxID=2853163 RepID=UPI001C45453D|nr:DNA methyltransferase [Comamonas sp. NLF-1-9]QXL84387.1 class I SAM-dependent DNA methyltransferase [Comamonas sp. NLF-1-9]
MPLSWNEIKSRALAFSRTWDNAANEDSEAKPFWIAFFEIFGITDKRVATFELNVKKHGGGQGFVDLFWPGMLLVEQKSRGRSLDAAFDQALGYFPGILERDLPQIIIVCDFARFRVHQLASGKTTEFALADLHKHVRLFGFIAGYRVQEITAQNPVNIHAAERMGRLHDALKASGYGGHALEVLLVRLLFCLFADDTGIFQPAQALRLWVEERTAPDGSDLGPRLAQLFQVLNTPEHLRSKHLDEQLAAFPYVNGRLFEEPLPLADFDADMRTALLDACALDWSAISPAIFGSLFQSIMDAKARRNLGAHYTSEENILKLIKPLFLDALWAEFHKVKNNKNRLFEFHKKLRQLTFFDPACGCGNFLVISYRELRLLELEVLRASYQSGQQTLDVHQLISLDVDQFFGIEIEEFPAQIAQVALWLVDHQMNLRVSEEFGLYFARIPLKSSARVVHGNALTLDWNEVLPAEQCSYVLGNPPFLGKKEQSAAQKEAFALVMGQIKGFGVLDFVAAWYIKAARYMQGAVSTPSPSGGRLGWGPGVLAEAGTRAGAAGPHPCPPPKGEGVKTRAAFVSTNSITQGEQVGVLWGWLLAQGIHIHFAHRTFRWSNEASGKAAVHCVIVGFGLQDLPNKVIYEYEDIKGEPLAVPAANINPYLVDYPDLVLQRRSSPLCATPPLIEGITPLDNGILAFTADEKQAFLAKEPGAERWFRTLLTGNDFINDQQNFCLWLSDARPSDLRAMPHVMTKVAEVKRFRENSRSSQKFAATPWLFRETTIPERYILIPKTSSERRRFFPLGFVDHVVVTNSALYMDGGGLYEFGILCSTMHNAWLRIVGGRLKSDFRYSAAIVYNNFPWPDLPAESEPNQPLTPVHKAQAAIETAAQAVLAARASFPGSSLADLYDPLTMPPALLKAHQKLDAAVDAAYALCGGKKTWKSDAERVAYLFERYQQLTSLLPVGKAKADKKRVT